MEPRALDTLEHPSTVSQSDFLNTKLGTLLPVQLVGHQCCNFWLVRAETAWKRSLQK